MAFSAPSLYPKMKSLRAIVLIHRCDSCLLFFNCCLIVVGGFCYFFPPLWRSTINKKVPNVRLREKWASRCLTFIGQIHFFSIFPFCLKTDLKHLENLSIQREYSGAFFLDTVGSYAICLMESSAAIYSHFPRVLWSVAKQNSLIMGPITICSLCERIQGEVLEGALVSKKPSF